MASFTDFSLYSLDRSKDLSSPSLVFKVSLLEQILKSLLQRLKGMFFRYVPGVAT